MAIYQTSEGEPLVFSEGALPGYTGPLIRGAQMFYTAQEKWQIMMQEIRSELYSIRHFFLSQQEAFHFKGKSNTAGIHSRFMLRNHARHKIEGVGKLRLGEGEFTALWSEQASCEAKFKAAGDYEAIDVYCAPGLAEQISAFFPELETVMRSGDTRLLMQPPCFISPALKDILRQMIDCPYDNATREFYFDIKVRELLYVMLEQGRKEKVKVVKLSGYERSLVTKAKDLLVQDLGRKPYTLRELSRAVALNEFKLKNGFKEMYGVGIFEYVTDARMEKAKELLTQTNKPIKEICSLAGYTHMTSFITAFRQRFGYTPGSLRRS